jgi:hypothetical protein
VYVSDERICSIFRIEENPSEKPGLSYSSTPQLEEICFSEISVHFRRSARHCIPESRSVPYSNIFHITAVELEMSSAMCLLGAPALVISLFLPVMAVCHIQVSSAT